MGENFLTPHSHNVAYEEGTPEEDTSAGIIVQVAEDDYSAANRKVRELTAKQSGVDSSFYRLGLNIID